MTIQVNIQVFGKHLRENIQISFFINYKLVLTFTECKNVVKKHPSNTWLPDEYSYQKLWDELLEKSQPKFHYQIGSIPLNLRSKEVMIFELPFETLSDSYHLQNYSLPTSQISVGLIGLIFNMYSQCIDCLIMNSFSSCQASRMLTSSLRSSTYALCLLTSILNFFASFIRFEISLLSKQSEK